MGWSQHQFFFKEWNKTTCWCRISSWEYWEDYFLRVHPFSKHDLSFETRLRCLSISIQSNWCFMPPGHFCIYDWCVCIITIDTPRLFSMNIMNILSKNLDLPMVHSPGDAWVTSTLLGTLCKYMFQLCDAVFHHPFFSGSLCLFRSSWRNCEASCRRAVFPTALLLKFLMCH